MWSETEERFQVLGKSTQTGKKSRKKTIANYPEIDFGTQTERNTKPAMLVDYYGGCQIVKVPGAKSQTTVKDESATELLVITPDGKIRVRDGREDADPDSDRGGQRLERYETWKTWIKDLTEEKEDKKDPKKGKKFGFD
jgi:hypothetical protein